MNIPVFGHKEIIKALLKLGFKIDNTRGKGSHVIATHPTKKQISPRQRPFITIAHRKEYYLPSRLSFVKEIMNFGFTKEEIFEALFGRKK